MDQKGNAIADLAATLTRQAGAEPPGKKKKEKILAATSAEEEASLESEKVRQVTIHWADTHDAGYAESWPDEVVHNQMQFSSSSRRTASLIEFDDTSPISLSFNRLMERESFAKSRTKLRIERPERKLDWKLRERAVRDWANLSRQKLSIEKVDGQKIGEARSMKNLMAGKQSREDSTISTIETRLQRAVDVICIPLVDETESSVEYLRKALQTNQVPMLTSGKLLGSQA